MNKPAPKEPSMDEILSSIRQIIADDDAGTAVRRPSPLGATRLAPIDVVAEDADAVAEEEPLALSAAQILAQPVPEEPGPSEFAALLADAEADELEPATAPYASAQFIDPEDVAFDSDLPEPEPEPVLPPAAVVAPPPVVSAPPVRPRPTAAEAAPMPDPTLSHDIAEELLEPTTQAAVRANFARLNQIGLGTPGLTIEALMRDMLKPMLKDWLDENLPAVVERMVEKEIARISRGVE